MLARMLDKKLPSIKSRLAKQEFLSKEYISKEVL